MEFDPLSKLVIGCAIKVHQELGLGLLESTYEKCLVHELRQKDIDCVAQMPLPIKYKGLHLDCGYRVDILVDNTLFIGLKSVNLLQRIDDAQLLTYMKMANIKIGLLINFNVNLLKDGIKRFVL